jgi:UDP-N-acetylglucosamine acyltransferase
MSDEDVREVEDIYRVIYVQNNNVTKGIEAVIDSMPISKLRTQIIDFIRNSEKGVIKGMI